MDNYKIKVKDEAESKEAQELLKQLGFQEEGLTDIDLPCYLATWDGGYADYYIDSLSERKKREELTLPQLRDLVAQSKSNLREYLDSNDNYKLCLINPSEAAHWMIEVPEGADCLMQWPTGHKVFYRGKFAKSWNSAYREWQFVSGDDGIDQSSTLWKRATQDPALISGAEAKLAWAKGEIVEYFRKSRDEWFEVKGNTFVSVFDTAEKLRIKPQTIKLELELPKPFEPKVGEEVWFISDDHGCGYSRYEHGEHSTYVFGCWSTEAEVKQVVEQLRKIRGTNS
ncbi:hypothetical protein NRA52_12160 [Acinetobacter baumannii]|nr:hypothetical protein [Acinetobacter baumannii]